MTTSATGQTVELSKQEIQRYSRHLILPEVTLVGQKKLKAASVLVIGAGGLGAPVSMYLTAAGIGRLGQWPPRRRAFSGFLLLLGSSPRPFLPPCA